MTKETIKTLAEVWQGEAGRRLAKLRQAQLAKNSFDIEWFFVQVKSANQLAAKYRRQLKEVYGK